MTSTARSSGYNDRSGATEHTFQSEWGGAFAYSNIGLAGAGSASAPRASDSGHGASEHMHIAKEDKISVDDVIAKFEAIQGTTESAERTLAAAITLRDNSGRDRKQALRSMAATWNVARYYKVDDKWKDRSVSAVAKDLEAAVCDAALKWESDSHQKVLESKTRGAAEHVETPPPKGSQSANAGPNSRVDEGVAVTKS